MLEIGDDLKICPKCKAVQTFEGDEVVRPCLKCGTKIRFYNYRPLPKPPAVPKLSTNDFWLHSHTHLILASVACLSLLVLIAFWNSMILVIASALICLGFGVVTFLKQKELRAIEQQFEHYLKVTELANQLHGRCSELTNRYMSLLATGDQRIGHHQAYYIQQTDVFQKRADEEIGAAKAQQAKATQKMEQADGKVREVESRMFLVAERIVSDNVKWSSTKLRPDPDSFIRQQTTLNKTFTFVESVGYPIPKSLTKKAIEDLRTEFQKKVREQQLKDEQRRIRQQAIEDAKNQRLIEEREREAREAVEREAELSEKLAKAIAEKQDIHSAEMEELKRQLAEAQAKSERAKSLAQMTKVGNVYVLSNIGSFGENVFKIGMTRREDPNDRVKELGDASVPFQFDVHAMITCQNAPELENRLHKELARYRVNRVNLRKEYFRVPIDEIVKAVKKHHGEVVYEALPEALEYRESLEISPDELAERIADLSSMGININEDDELEAE